MIEIYSKEINEIPMSIETSTKLKTSSDKYLQIENILGTLLNKMEEGGGLNQRNLVIPTISYDYYFFS